MIRWKPLRCAAFVTACLDDNGCSVTLINATPFPYSAICTQALALWLAHSHMAGEKLLSPTKGLKMDQLHSSRTLFPRREREGRREVDAVKKEIHENTGFHPHCRQWLARAISFLWKPISVRQQACYPQSRTLW